MPGLCSDRRDNLAAAGRLLTGNRPELPAAVVAFASWPRQTMLRGTLADIADQMHEAQITETIVIIVGYLLAVEGSRTAI